MKKNIFILFILAAIIFLFFADNVFATVGGPTYVDEIVYDSAKNAVYYVIYDNSGRGCPPSVRTLDLKTGKSSELITSTLKTCDEIYKNIALFNEEEYEKAIQDTLKPFTYLQDISLKKNHFSFEKKVLNQRSVDNYFEVVDFRTTVFQDGVKKTEIDHTGCTVDQPDIIEGYLIPGTDKMVILLSGISDCFEGGYIGESVHLINGIKYYDTSYVGGGSRQEGVSLNDGNKAVYASTDKDVDTSGNCPEINKQVGTDVNYIKSFWKNKTNLIFLIPAFLFGLIIGLFIGFLIKKKRATLPEMSDKS